jgi:hypothetical protein
LHALADLAVLKGDDTDAPLPLTTREIAEQFVELYWRQCRPFQISAASGLILQQNTGKQAAIVAHIVGSQGEHDASLFRLKQAASGRWSALVAEVDQVVRTMPLWKLPSSSRVRLLLERRAEAAEDVEAEWGWLPADARAALPAPDDLLAGA